MTTLQKQMHELQMQVIDNCYYENIYNSCLKKHEMSRIGVRDYLYSDAKIVDMCNDFWLDLPDCPSIRTRPFFLLCDIAEHCFDAMANESEDWASNMKQTRVYNMSDDLLVDVVTLWQDRVVTTTITLVRSHPHNYFVHDSKQNETYVYNGIDFVKE